MKRARDGMALHVAYRNAGRFGQGWIVVLKRSVEEHGCSCWCAPFLSCQCCASGTIFVTERQMRSLFVSLPAGLVHIGEHFCLASI